MQQLIRNLKIFLTGGYAVENNLQQVDLTGQAITLAPVAPLYTIQRVISIGPIQLLQIPMPVICCKNLKLLPIT